MYHINTFENLNFNYKKYDNKKASIAGFFIVIFFVIKV